MMSSDFEAYRQAKEQIAQLEAEMAEFRASSRELEQELELELEESEERHKSSQMKINQLTLELDQVKEKYRILQKEFAASQSSLQREISTLQNAHKESSHRLREIEMANDDMERTERITKSTLGNLENKYHSSLEQIAMLEAELASTDDSQIELQRAKDELRDTKEELAVAQGRIERLEKNAHRTVPVRRASRTYGQPPVLLSVSRSSSRAGVPTKRMTSSKSLKRIHGMLDQMKNLESRVATFKSTLPKPVAVNTPSKHHLTSPPLHSNTPSPVPRYRASQDHLSEFAQTHHGHHYSPSTASIPSTSSRSKRNSFSLEPGLGSGTAATPTDLHRSQSSASRSASSNHVVVPRTARSPRTRHSVDMMSSLSIADQHQHYSQKHHNSSAINLGTTTTTDNTTPTKQHRFNGSFYTHHKMASTTSVTSSGSQQQHHHPSFGVLHSRQSATLSHGTRM